MKHGHCLRLYVDPFTALYGMSFLLYKPLLDRFASEVIVGEAYSSIPLTMNAILLPRSGF